MPSTEQLHIHGHDPSLCFEAAEEMKELLENLLSEVDGVHRKSEILGAG